MIYLYSGTPGSGKSLHTARVIRNTLMLNKPVIANIPINTSLCKHSERFLHITDGMLRPSALVDYSREYFKDRPVKEGEILLIIDEAQRMFNARDWSKSDRAGWNEFSSFIGIMAMILSLWRSLIGCWTDKCGL
ncbi:DUF2075 domain-containing protein [Clostridium sp. OF09-36]|uniref:zonular occludens toxin domain-containing protein n=1 Tax=Clostridium sp. OF09-36 TaxID=2292310 RepID=UPI000E4AB92A|nr:zonular occludens toxin domain-containing protein [Clostridium sp. OF09-36]RHV88032.1 DUF2075 domain-containing protein [Clostridium sp. OF09-36]